MGKDFQTQSISEGSELIKNDEQSAGTASAAGRRLLTGQGERALFVG